MVCGGCEQCELAVVLRLGLWRTVASPLVCQTPSLAGVGYSDWPDNVGVVRHAGDAFVQFALTTCANIMLVQRIVKINAICLQIKASFKSIDLY